MPGTIDQKVFTKELFDILDEAFVTHHGIFLDKGTSLFETLESVSADEASVPVGGTCATLAAQVAHITFYLEVIEKYMMKEQPGSVDWGEIWRNVSAVTPGEWTAYRRQLKLTYERVLSRMLQVENWNDEDVVGGALAIAVHTAYHLGEIRQALCIVKQ
jgi:hypothetical protein